MASRVYTKTGDKGQTSLVDGKRVSKTHIRIESYGTVDELNSFIGLLLSELDQNLFKNEAYKLVEIQHNLFNIGSHLATQDPETVNKLPKIEESLFQSLEQSMDQMTTELPELREFILPGGSKPASLAHICRTVCRRAERLSLELSETESINPTLLIYLNRLSDYFFVLSRQINSKMNVEQPKWQKS